MTTEPTPPTTTQTSPSPLAMHHYPQAQSTFSPPLIAHTNHYLGDVSSSFPLEPEKPISAGFYYFTKGTPLEYTYTYHEMKIILEGEGVIKDRTGQEVVARKGDVFYFPRGSVITFEARSEGGVRAFYCGQRGRGEA